MGINKYTQDDAHDPQYAVLADGTPRRWEDVSKDAMLDVRSLLPDQIILCKEEKEGGFANRRTRQLYVFPSCAILLNDNKPRSYCCCC